MTPTLILTRPAAQSERFAAQVAARWDGPLHIITSPLIRIEPLRVEIARPDAVIFTSANGVLAAKALALPHGLRAWCVGQKTAEAARDAGFDASVGPGDAEGLVCDIVTAHPKGTLAHIRGKHARGDVSAKLNAAGLDCIDVVAYDQVALPLSDEAQSMLEATNPVIFPLFSPRTATILNGQGPFTAPIWGVALSDAVDSAMDRSMFRRVNIAKKPDGLQMLAATVATISAVVETK